jgi:hypothetical protein
MEGAPVEPGLAATERVFSRTAGTALRTGMENEGVVGLHQPGIPLPSRHSG